MAGLFRIVLLPEAGARQLVRLLPATDLVLLGAAIFLLFSTMGFLTDVMAGGTLPLWLLTTNVLFAGTIAVGYAAAGLLRPWALVPLIVIHIVYGLSMRGAGGEPPADLQARLTADAVGVIVAMASSYGLFITFIGRTGTRLVEARAEMRLASEIHAVLVPGVARRIGGFEFFGLARASGDVGGDLVDLVPVCESSRGGNGQEGGWIGYVADVSGHGVTSGVLMGMTKSAARMKLRAGGGLAELLDEVNAVIYDLKRPSMFVTFAGVRRAPAGDLEVAVAGHLPILRITRAGDVEEITTPQIPLGVFPDWRFAAARVECAPGELLALITDGLTEVFDREDREFGLEGVKQHLVTRRAAPLETIASTLVEAVHQHGAQIDDQTLLLIRRL